MVKAQVVSVRLSRLRLASADAIAKRRGISRSQLIDEALRTRFRADLAHRARKRCIHERAVTRIACRLQDQARVRRRGLHAFDKSSLIPT